MPLHSPKRQADELRVLMKPHDWTRQALVHRVAADAGRPEVEQPWHADDEAVLLERAMKAADRLTLTLQTVETDADERLRLEVVGTTGPAVESSLRAVAATCSALRPKLWFVIGRVAMHQGQFWRRKRGATPQWIEHKSLHLTRDARAAVRDLLKRPVVDDAR